MTTENVHIKFQPENLGKVHISTNKTPDGHSFVIQLENNDVKQVLESDPKYLKKSLEENGVKVKNIELQNYHFNQNENHNNFGQESKTNFFRIEHVPGNEHNIQIKNLKFS